MLSESNPISRAVPSYWIVYFIIFLGIIGVLSSAIGPTHVALEKQPLCIVLDDAVFGPGGTFLREVNMDEFG
jgi:hypothetical protein